jgi:predicted transglutaminase-like cysteine proteinase
MRRRLLIAASMGLVVPAPRVSAKKSSPGEVPPDRLAIGHATFDALVREAALLPPLERIVFANVEINRRVDFIDDAVLGEGDVWLAPFETLARGHGDCEDIAIAKFFVLLAAGFDPADVRLLYARYHDLSVPGLATAHLVAIARQPFDDPFVLDNLNLLLLPISQRSDLEPVFSFDRAHLWEGAEGRAHGSSVELLPAWRHLLLRMATQHDDGIVSFPGRPH